MRVKPKGALSIIALGAVAAVLGASAAQGHLRGWDDCADACPENNSWSGHEHSDAMFSRGGVDVVLGFDADDFIDTGASPDIGYGENGPDDVFGGSETDILRGQDGDDLLQGDGAGDELHGGPGDDTLKGSDGHDHCWGGGGNDTYFNCHVHG